MLMMPEMLIRFLMNIAVMGLAHEECTYSSITVLFCVLLTVEFLYHNITIITGRACLLLEYCVLWTDTVFQGER